MSESLTAAIGRKVVSRSSAEEVGQLAQLLLNPEHNCVQTLMLGSGRHARMLDWQQVTGFGPDAIMIDSFDSLREPRDERENAAAGGDLEFLGKRALSDDGNELGAINDLSFDPQSGQLQSIFVGPDEYPAAALRGVGSYAVVLVGDGPREL